MSNNIHKRGFASMTFERRKEIASKGGKAAHQSGYAHEWTPEEAKKASQKRHKVYPNPT
jgi:general stress protein YciG